MCVTDKLNIFKQFLQRLLFSKNTKTKKSQIQKLSKINKKSTKFGSHTVYASRLEYMERTHVKIDNLHNSKYTKSGTQISSYHYLCLVYKKNLTCFFHTMKDQNFIK